MKLATLELVIMDTNNEIIKENLDHAARLKVLQDTLTKTQTAKLQVMMGADVERVANAERFIYIRGFKRLTPDMLMKATNDVLKGFIHMRSRTISIKDYASFSGQEVDCEYGLGPTHGYIVCEIGLTKEYRKTNGATPAVVSENDIEDILYFLALCSDEAYVKTRTPAEERRR